MAGWTNKLKYNMLNWIFRAQTIPTNFYIALITDATAPTQDTNTFSQLTEIANGNGYTTGGYQLTKDATDFDVLTEDDSGDKGLIQIKDVTWTAATGNLPASGDGARYAVLLDDNGTIGSREVLGYWDLSSARTVSVGQNLTLQNLEIDLNES